MVLLLLLAITAISCVGVLVWTLQSVIGMSDQIVSEQVAEQEKISGLSRQFTYINSQVLTHVMTTNSVTMDTLSEKILQDIADMEQQIEEFGALLSEEMSVKKPWTVLLQNWQNTERRWRVCWSPVPRTKPRHMYLPHPTFRCLMNISRIT